MKRLLLLRHAKSSWHDPSLADFERPLSQRGRAAARMMGNYLGSVR
jgi:phosphohistidine phosphatase